MASFKWDKTGLFAAGVLFGTAGIKLLSSKDAKKVYTECTAAVLRAKDCVMKTVTTVQENAGDIYADAKVWHSTSKYRRVIWQCNTLQTYWGLPFLRQSS